MTKKVSKIKPIKEYEERRMKALSHYERMHNNAYRVEVEPVKDQMAVIDVIEQVKVNNVLVNKIVKKEVPVAQVIGDLTVSDLALENLIAIGADASLKIVKLTDSKLNISDNVEGQFGKIVSSPSVFEENLSSANSAESVDNINISNE